MPLIIHQDGSRQTDVPCGVNKMLFPKEVLCKERRGSQTVPLI